MTPAEGLKTEPEKLRRQYELRRRREAIIRELTRPRALSDDELITLTREMRRIQAELDGRDMGAA